MALTPLIVAVLRSPPAGALPVRRAFSLGVVAGAGYFSGTLYWLVETMTTFGGLAPPVAVLAAAALVAYLSLFPGVFAAVLARLRSSLGATTAVWCAAPVWVTTELGRQYVWDGFPWALLGYSQVTTLPVAQLASLTGVYSLSGLLTLTAAAAALPIVDLGRRRWAPAIVAVAIVGATAAWGTARINDGSLVRSGDPVRVGVVQANIAQDDKWDPTLRDAIVDRYVKMTHQAIGQGATFILWPESAMPVNYEDDLVRSAVVKRVAREAGVTLLIGSDQEEPQGARPSQPGYHLYNAAFLVKPDGSTAGVYRKMHLVPFGEYVPLQRLFFFAAPIVESVSHFTPGADPVLLPVDGHKVSTAICYEVIFGSLMRRFVTDGSELLTTITNDAWYGWSSAAYQHWDQASMRAIENGRYLARAANTGISGFVDPYGRVVEKSALFEQDVLVQDIRFLQHRTVYSHIGDLVAWLSLVFTVAVLAVSSRLSAFSKGKSV